MGTERGQTLCQGDELNGILPVVVADLPCPSRLRALPIGQAVPPRDIRIERAPLHRHRRVDFSNVVLLATFDLPCQRQGLDRLNGEEGEEEGEEEEEEEEAAAAGEKERSEGEKEQSESSTECSQEAAPSTLLADEQREGRCRASGADGDQELEEGSKTLVLFSPGDARKSPTTADLAPDAEQGTLAAVTPQSERPQPLGSQLDVSEPGTLSSVLKSESKPLCPIATATTSSPFTKVERTFLHIAEKTHLNVMSSSGQLLPQDHYEFFQPPVLENGSWSLTEGPEEGEAEVLGPSRPQPQAQAGETTAQNGAGTGEGAPAENLPDGERGEDSEAAAPVETTKPPDQDPRDGSEGEGSRTVMGNGNLRAPARSRWKSRIPVLMSEEDTGSDHSAPLSFKDRLSQKRSRHLDLARFLMERRQNRLMRINSVTSSSASSGEERRRGSRSPPATASEEDTYSDSSLHRVGEGSETPSPGGRRSPAPIGKSKIPRPITPVKMLQSCPSPPSAPSSPNTSPSKPPPAHRFEVHKGSGSSGSKIEIDSPTRQTHRPPLTLGPQRESPRTPSPRAPPRSPIFPARSLSASPRIKPLSRTDSPSPCRQRRATFDYKRLHMAYPGTGPRPHPSPPAGGAQSSPTGTYDRHGARARSQAPATKGRQQTSEGKQAVR
ncbi:tau-tubulin kinase 1-like [Heptranchias perlo]|uniref:tau-tubulin kinase 1-like n=1 Tax=Heptranchias perlo TaxID=212740 RepID=UPI00355A6C90